MASTLFGLTKVEQQVEEKNEKVSPFEFIKDLSQNKEYLFSEETKSGFSPFIINKSFSSHPDTLFDAVFLNSNSHLPLQMQHDYLYYKVPRRKRWKEWLSKSEAEKKTIQAQQKLSSVLGCGEKDIKFLWSILSDSDKKDLIKKYVEEKVSV